MAVCVLALITPAGSHGQRDRIPVAFFAVVSIAVIGLYIAYVMPVYLRWRAGDYFVPGAWTLGRQVQVDEPGRGDLGDPLVIIFSSVHPGRRAVERRVRLVGVNYAPLTVGGLFILVGLWWLMTRRTSTSRAGAQPERWARDGDRRGTRQLTRG